MNARQIEDTKMNEIENWVLAAMRSFLYGHNINAVGGIENVFSTFHLVDMNTYFGGLVISILLKFNKVNIPLTK